MGCFIVDRMFFYDFFFYCFIACVCVCVRACADAGRIAPGRCLNSSSVTLERNLLLLALIACTRTDYQSIRKCKQQPKLLALMARYLHCLDAGSLPCFSVWQMRVRSSHGCKK